MPADRFAVVRRGRKDWLLCLLPKTHCEAEAQSSTAKSCHSGWSSGWSERRKRHCRKKECHCRRTAVVKSASVGGNGRRSTIVTKLQWSPNSAPTGINRLMFPLTSPKELTRGTPPRETREFQKARQGSARVSVGLLQVRWSPTHMQQRKRCHGR